MEYIRDIIFCLYLSLFPGLKDIVYTSIGSY